MATLTISVTNQEGVNSVSLIYEVSSTNDTTTVTVTTLVCRSAVTRTYFPVSVKCDGMTLYSNTVEFTSSGIAYAINKTKSFARNTSAASKSLTLTALGTSNSATITVPALPSYTVTYSGNGSTGGSTASQTKYYGKSLTLRSNGFTRTNYVFKNWNTNSAGTGTAYASGANYTGNAALTLYAQWYAPYTVAYNANGGTGAPASQVKVYNTALTLRTEKPTRPDFVFMNWNTSSAGSGTSYASGGSYTANANATLYAQWRRIYSNPNVSIMSVQRVDATTHEADDVGTSVAVEISWSLFDTPSGTNHPTSIVVACNGATETLADLTGLTGTATAYLDAGCYPDQQYPVTATLTDEGGASRSVTAEGVVTTPYYPIDIRQGGRGVAIGGPSAEDALDIFMPVKVLPRATSTSETPLTINDGTNDVFKVDWDGTVDIGPTAVTAEDSGLKVHGSNLSTASQTASANLYALIAGMFDGGGNFRSYLKHVDLANGNQGVQVETRRVVNGSDVYNGVRMLIDPSGNRYVVVSDRAAWLSALGYTAPTALPLASGCVAYSSGQTPRYSRDGHVVCVWGAVKPSAEVAAGGTLTIGTLPAGYRPPYDVHVLCQGSGQNKWVLTVSSSGVMTAARYSSGATSAAMSTSVWLPFCATFITTS